MYNLQYTVYIHAGHTPHTHLGRTFNRSSCDSSKCGSNSLTTRKPKGNHNTVALLWRWFRRYTWLIRSCFPFQRHSFVALGLPRKAQCPCSGKKNTSLQTAHTDIRNKYACSVYICIYKDIFINRHVYFSGQSTVCPACIWPTFAALCMRIVAQNVHKHTQNITFNAFHIIQCLSWSIWQSTAARQSPPIGTLKY